MLESSQAKKLMKCNLGNSQLKTGVEVWLKRYTTCIASTRP
jgi:hypothetical protein